MNAPYATLAGLRKGRSAEREANGIGNGAVELRVWHSVSVCDNDAEIANGVHAMCAELWKGEREWDRKMISRKKGNGSGNSMECPMMS